MDKLQISSGLKRIQITDENNKEKGVLKFNPSLIKFIERYQSLLINFKKRSLEAEVYLASIYVILATDEELDEMSKKQLMAYAKDQKITIPDKKRSTVAICAFIKEYQAEQEVEGDNAGKMSIEDDRKMSDEVLKEINCLYDFVDEEIDALFGAGSSAMLFSKERDIGEYDQFLEGIAPYIQKERTKKTDPYSARKKSKKASARTKTK